MSRKIVLALATFALLVSGGAILVGFTNASATASEGVTVIVADGDLPPGAPAASLAGAIRAERVAANLVPEGALTSLENAAGLQTTTPIFDGQVLIRRQFAETSATGGLPIPPGRTAVAVKLDDPERVAGFVEPGSKVMVFQNVDETASVLLKDAPVVAVGPSTTSNGEASDSADDKASTVVTFALTPEEATKVVSAVSNGSLYLGLLPA